MMGVAQRLREMVFHTDLRISRDALKRNDECIIPIGQAGLAVGGDLQMLAQQGGQLVRIGGCGSGGCVGIANGTADYRDASKTCRITCMGSY